MLSLQDKTFIKKLTWLSLPIFTILIAIDLIHDTSLFIPIGEYHYLPFWPDVGDFTILILCALETTYFVFKYKWKGIESEIKS